MKRYFLHLVIGAILGFFGAALWSLIVNAQAEISPFISYRIAWVLQNEDGKILKARVKFFEGNYEIATGQEIVTEKPITEELFVNKNLLKDEILTPNELGNLYTINELSGWLKNELTKDALRQPRLEQRL